jgi:hypothetical protein
LSNRSLRCVSSPLRFPRRLDRHLADLAHPLLGGPRDHQRLVDPRFQLGDRRHRRARHDPVLGVVPLRPLDK